MQNSDVIVDVEQITDLAKKYIYYWKKPETISDKLKIIKSAYSRNRSINSRSKRVYLKTNSNVAEHTSSNSKIKTNENLTHEETIYNENVANEQGMSRQNYNDTKIQFSLILASLKK